MGSARARWADDNIRVSGSTMRGMVLIPVALLAGEAAVRAADVQGSLSGNDQLQRALYGAPRDAAIEQMLATPADYEGRAVTLRGRFARLRDRGEFQLGTEPHALRVEP